MGSGGSKTDQKQEQQQESQQEELVNTTEFEPIRNWEGEVIFMYFLRFKYFLNVGLSKVFTYTK